MNLAEVLAAALVLACASGGSLRIWAASTAAAATVEQRGGQLLDLDRAVLEAEVALREGLPAEPGPDCAVAAQRLASRLAALPLPAGVGRELQAEAGGVWLRLQSGVLPVRERWLDAAALGACAAASEIPEPDSTDSSTDSSTEEGDGTPDLTL